jgi:hypothetical protein
MFVFVSFKVDLKGLTNNMSFYHVPSLLSLPSFSLFIVSLFVLIVLLLPKNFFYFHVYKYHYLAENF